MNTRSRPVIRLSDVIQNAVTGRRFLGSFQSFPKSNSKGTKNYKAGRESKLMGKPLRSKVRNSYADMLGSKGSLVGHSILRGQTLRRSFLYVPAHSERFINKALTSTADCIVLDLEDGVAESQKNTARDNIRNLLHRLADEGYRPGENKGAELCLRINNEGWLRESSWRREGTENIVAPTDTLDKDLELLGLPQGFRLTVVVPKANNPVNLRYISNAVMVKRLQHTSYEEAIAHRLNMIPIIETPHGVMNIAKYASFGGWFSGMVFAAEDYCASLGIPRTEDYSNMLFARSSIVNLCKMMGLSTIDMVCQDFKRPDVLLEECNDGLYHGFEGKQTIHPDQIDIINKAFSPRPSEVQWARDLLHEVEKRPEDGAFEFNGKMVDRPVFRKAENILARCKKIIEFEEARFQTEEAIEAAKEVKEDKVFIEGVESASQETHDQSVTAEGRRGYGK
ncbi:hypothetical protein TWF694_007706 [Orbilia ellipsospora]|uniref:HpcH/HpaI aldolase/citrate lyase domain-containing protein n=1 Tax=Orbilia ellipsospora TaxID=2528407 RepID=A0AAV9XK14_9PEZI